MHDVNHFELSYQNACTSIKILLAGWLCLTFHRQIGHLETVPSFTVPCEGREAWFLHGLHRESNPGLLPDSPLHNRCAKSAQS